MQEFIFKNESEAQAACEWWQKQLRLTDWDISLHIVKYHEFDEDVIKNGKVGEANTLLCKKIAIINLLDAQDYPKGAYLIQDQELGLVHELLHVLNCGTVPVDEPDWMNLAKEQMIHSLSKTLINLRRLAYPKPPWRKNE